jgi:hypothetical protein
MRCYESGDCAERVSAIATSSPLTVMSENGSRVASPAPEDPEAMAGDATASTKDNTSETAAITISPSSNTQNPAAVGDNSPRVSTDISDRSSLTNESGIEIGPPLGTDPTEHASATTPEPANVPPPPENNAGGVSSDHSPAPSIPATPECSVGGEQATTTQEVHDEMPRVKVLRQTVVDEEDVVPENNASSKRKVVDDDLDDLYTAKRLKRREGTEERGQHVEESMPNTETVTPGQLSCHF